VSGVKNLLTASTQKQAIAVIRFKRLRSLKPGGPLSTPVESPVDSSQLCYRLYAPLDQQRLDARLQSPLDSIDRKRGPDESIVGGRGVRAHAATARMFAMRPAWRSRISRRLAAAPSVERSNSLRGMISPTEGRLRVRSASQPGRASAHSDRSALRDPTCVGHHFGCQSMLGLIRTIGRRTIETITETRAVTPWRRPWNKGKLIGPKPPLQPKHVWGHSDAVVARRAHAGPGALQSRDR
jgi:hypothetical protein